MFLIYKKRDSFLALVAVIIFLASSATFALPRETFDPHFGFDDDIFCVIYNSFTSVDNVISDTSFASKEIEIDISLNNYLPPELVLIKHFTERAPPLMSAA